MIQIAAPSTAFLLALFLRRAEVICDVGSCDGDAARRFKRWFPKSRVVAFEANPDNAALIARREQESPLGIELRHHAVWNKNQTLTFNIEQVPAGEEWRQGSSSLLQKQNDSLLDRVVEVQAHRLDEVIDDLSEKDRIALWMDVEGVAYQVLEGLEGIARRITVINVEVELEAVWEGQRLKTDIVVLMDRLGFECIMASPPSGSQQDLLFVNRRNFLRTGFGLRAFQILSLAAAKAHSALLPLLLWRNRRISTAKK